MFQAVQCTYIQNDHLNVENVFLERVSVFWSVSVCIVHVCTCGSISSDRFGTFPVVFTDAAVEIESHMTSMEDN